jgi:HAE1 family hydrophobic/amphiphilic exporter-1
MCRLKATYRTSADNLGKFYVNNAAGDMVPLSTLTTTYPRSGPEFIMKYNLFNCVQINGSAAPGYSSGQAIAALEDVFKKTMPAEMGFDYMGMSYQEVKAAQGVSPTSRLRHGLLLIVFLIMAAQYESWTLPLSVLLGLPIAVSSAPSCAPFAPSRQQCLRADRPGHADRPLGQERHPHRRICQDGIRQGGKTLIDAALTGARLRLRPILMTAFAFILGCVPLCSRLGAQAPSRGRSSDGW